MTASLFEVVGSLVCLGSAAFSMGLISGFALGRYAGLQARLEQQGIRLIDGGKDDGE